MRNPRHFFILVGLLGQALTWEHNLFLVLTGALWGVAIASRYFKIPWFGPWNAVLTTRKHRVALSTEAVALVLGCVLSIVINKMLHRTAHFFLGDGLALLQLVRLSRPALHREKLTSLIIACFHFGVLCTLAPNIRFVILFAAAIVLFPKALKEVLTATDDCVKSGDPSLGLGAGRLTGIYRYVLPPPVYIALIVLSGAVFLSFPRFTGSPLQLRDGLIDHGSLLDSVLDPRRSGRANSQQVLMQIEGDDVGYLRCFTLTKFDGVRWLYDRAAKLYRIRPDSDRMQGAKQRTVYVKTPQYLGKFVPADGHVVRMDSNFFPPAWVSTNDTIEVHPMWNTGDNWYRYWIDETPDIQPLNRSLRDELTFHPAQSETLKRWVAEKAANGTNALSRARELERYLRANFNYELGTPELNRLAPVDDFIFNRKEGHCERFAAAMALFLRMEGIPSRVVIGYAATGRNFFTDRLQVRFRDAHSWAEGFFEGRGWVTFDATPGPSSPEGVGSELMDFLDALDFVWYSYVVNFNGFGQRELISSGLQFAARVPQDWWKSALWICLAALAFAISLKMRPPGWSQKLQKLFTRRRQERFAEHSYGEMLQALARTGVRKAPQLTPLEFLEQLRKQSFPGYNPAALVTQAFCLGTYGGKPLPAEMEEQVRAALAELKRSQTQHPNGRHHTVERS